MPSIHWRSSPGMRAVTGFGWLKVCPRFTDCVLVIPGASVRLVRPRFGTPGSNGIHRDIHVASAFRDAYILTAGREDAAAIRLPEVPERKRSVGVRGSIDHRRPTVQIHSTRNATNGCYIDRSLIISAIAWFETAHNKAYGKTSRGL